MRAKKSVSVKVMVLLLAVVLLIGGVVGGTLAYLIATTGAVQNTFVAGDIGTLKLEENTGESYMIIPGVDIDKNPKITFSGNNIAAYVFLKIDATGWTVSGAGTTYIYSIGDDQEMSWTLEGWTKLEKEEGVYYREVAADAAAQSWNIIKGNTITVSSEITEATVGNYAKNLTFTAYAIQADGFDDVAEAWAEAQKPTTT